MDEARRACEQTRAADVPPDARPRTGWLNRLSAAALPDLGEFEGAMLLDELAFRAARIDELEGVTFLAAMMLTSSAGSAAAGPAEPDLADAVADRVVARLGVAAADLPAACERAQVQRTRVTEASVLDDVALLERAARRLRRFVRAIVTRTIEVTP
jgi:hypothetical protein